MRGIVVFVSIIILMFIAVGCREHPPVDGNIINRDNKIIGQMRQNMNNDMFFSYGSNPVDIEYLFKSLQKYYPEIPESFKQKINNGETGAWIFEKVKVEVKHEDEKVVVIATENRY